MLYIGPLWPLWDHYNKRYKHHFDGVPQSLPKRRTIVAGKGVLRLAPLAQDDKLIADG